MRPITQIAALLLVAPLLAISATDTTAQKAPVAPGWVSTAGLPLDAIAHIEKGDHLIADRKYGTARMEYEAAVDVLEGQGDFPVVPIRRIADSYYFEGRYQTAVLTLDRLAEEAARNGDAVTQVWALADAAWVLGEDYKRRPRGGAKMELESRVARLNTLLAGQYLPEDVRQEVMAKRLDGCCLVLDSQIKPRLTHLTPPKQ